MTQSIKEYFPNASTIAYGCMGLGGGWEEKTISVEDVAQAHQVIDQALMCGINFFDHADIYTHGKAEKVFGQVIAERPELKDQIILQSKCGIRFNDNVGPGRYDLSPEWITTSVEGILSRLNIECLDILMLHRPDPLMEPDLIADTFNQLIASGKVKQFGVSNMNQSQIHFLQQHIKQPLIANQVEISLKNLNWLDEGVMVGMNEGASNNFSSGTIEHCRLNNIQIQAWGSLCQGLFSGANLSGQPEHYRHTAKLVSELAENYNCGKEAIILAWLMRHPANI
jgi:predicted oxidoreductase